MMTWGQQPRPSESGPASASNRSGHRLLHCRPGRSLLTNTVASAAPYSGFGSQPAGGGSASSISMIGMPSSIR